MARTKKKLKIELEPYDIHKSIRKLAYESKVAHMQEGRRQRAVKFTNRKKEASRKACRKGNW